MQDTDRTFPNYKNSTHQPPRLITDLLERILAKRVQNCHALFGDAHSGMDLFTDLGGFEKDLVGNLNVLIEFCFQL